MRVTFDSEASRSHTHSRIHTSMSHKHKTKIVPCRSHTYIHKQAHMPCPHKWRWTNTERRLSELASERTNRIPCILLFPSEHNPRRHAPAANRTQPASQLSESAKCLVESTLTLAYQNTKVPTSRTHNCIHVLDSLTGFFPHTVWYVLEERRKSEGLDEGEREGERER